MSHHAQRYLFSYDGLIVRQSACTYIFTSNNSLNSGFARIKIPSTIITSGMCKNGIVCSIVRYKGINGLVDVVAFF
jgi:hypothetical protein